jgi:hypothetical protein
MGKLLPLVLLAAVVLAGQTSCRRDHRIRNAAAAERRAAKNEASREKVYASCWDKRPEGAACGLIADRFFSEDAIDTFIDDRCAGEVDDLCRKALVAEWIDRLYDRYDAADVKAVGRFCVKHPRQCEDPEYFERVWLTLHNVGVEQRLKRKQAAINAGEREALNASRRRQEEAVRGAFAAAAAGLGAASRRSGAERAADTDVQQEQGCQFDVQCGPGLRCLKASGKLKGSCAKLVNDYGTPSYDMHAEPARCRFTTDCAIGFKCVDTFCRR